MIRGSRRCIRIFIKAWAYKCRLRRQQHIAKEHANPPNDELQPTCEC